MLTTHQILLEVVRRMPKIDSKETSTPKICIYGQKVSSETKVKKSQHKSDKQIFEFTPKD